MTQIGFAFNFNIQRCEIDVGDEKRIVDEGYRPLIELFSTYGLKANCFFSGFSSELLGEIDPAFLGIIKARNQKELEIGTYTYTHPIPQLLVPREFEMQIARGLELDRSILETETDGFLPPEFTYSKEMGKVLHEQGIRWFIALASQIEKGLAAAGIDRDPYKPVLVRVEDEDTLIAVPAAYQLPDTPERFFKLMMKGQLPVDTVIEGVKKFSERHPEGLLLFKRDAETIFIDKFNSGFDQTLRVMDEFLSKISALDMVESSWISEVIDENPPDVVIELPDYLGNTKIETFTEGAAEDLWNLTKKVRDAILKGEQRGLDPELLREAWNHLLLSHNSDGRIGYWFSEWNPGEHQVAPSRRQFVEDHLNAALDLMRK